MNRGAKSAALGFVAILAVIFVFNLFTRLRTRADDANTQKFIAEQQTVYQEQLKKSQEQLERAENLQLRNEKLIEKWEEQAKRIDAILTRLEKNK